MNNNEQPRVRLPYRPADEVYVVTTGEVHVDNTRETPREYVHLTLEADLGKSPSRRRVRHAYVDVLEYL